MSETSGRPLTSAAALYEAVDPLAESRWRLAFPLSTHYREPHQMQDPDRLIIRHYGELAGQILAERNGHQDGLG